MGPVIRNVIRDVIRPVMGDEALASRFVGPLDGFDTSAFVLTTAVLYSRQIGQPMFRIRRSADDNHCDVLPDTSALINGTYFVGLDSPVQNFETASGATTLTEFVSNGTNTLYGERMYFDGVDDLITLGSTITMSGDFSVSWTGMLAEDRNAAVFGVDTNNQLVHAGLNILRFRYGAVNYDFSGLGLSLHTVYNFTLSRVGTAGTLTVNGAEYSTTLPAIDITVNRIGDNQNVVNRFFGLLYDFNFNDQASYQGYDNTNAGWTDQIGSNDGTVNGSPALYTGQGFDAFVRTAYDPSGNSRNAGQATAASQPQIVSGGSLEMLNGNPAIRYDGTDDRLITASNTLDPGTTASIFSVAKDENTIAETSAWLSLRDGSNSGNITAFELGVFKNANFRIIYDPGADGANTTDTFNTAGTALNAQALMSAFATGTKLLGFENGASTIDLTPASTGDLGSGYGFTLGKHNATAQYAKGLQQAALCYLSDQSANRAAIEAKLAEIYGITLA